MNYQLIFHLNLDDWVGSGGASGLASVSADLVQVCLRRNLLKMTKTSIALLRARSERAATSPRLTKDAANIENIAAILVLKQKRRCLLSEVLIKVNIL